MATNATADGAKVDMMVAKSRYCPRRRVEVKGLARFQGDPACRMWSGAMLSRYVYWHPDNYRVAKPWLPRSQAGRGAASSWRNALTWWGRPVVSAGVQLSVAFA